MRQPFLVAGTHQGYDRLVKDYGDDGIGLYGERAGIGNGLADVQRARSLYGKIDRLQQGLVIDGACGRFRQPHPISLAGFQRAGRRKHRHLWFRPSHFTLNRWVEGQGCLD